jgi:hypothetical protein
MDFSSISDLFHDLSTGVITAIVLVSMAVSFFVFKYFDHDLWNKDTYGE